MTRKPPAISSFAPEILATLIEGSRRIIELEMPYSEAVVIRMRMHSLRARMRLDGHTLLNIVQGAKITIVWPEGTEVRESSRGVRYPKDPKTMVKLTVTPQDLHFTKAIKKAGISVDLPPSTPVLDTGTETPDHVIEDFLRQAEKKAS
jgi:hypothetical protein